MRKILFKGILRGTATSNKIGSIFVIKLDEKIEGLPKEFVVFNTYMGSDSRSPMGTLKNAMATPIRIGDKIIVEGEIIQEFKGKEALEYIRMDAKHVYNETLKYGF